MKSIRYMTHNLRCLGGPGKMPKGGGHICQLLELRDLTK
jgi:hypothetical protein